MQTNIPTNIQKKKKITDATENNIFRADNKAKSQTQLKIIPSEKKISGR